VPRQLYLYLYCYHAIFSMYPQMVIRYTEFLSGWAANVRSAKYSLWLPSSNHADPDRNARAELPTYRIA
jgi:hypothetical protein